MWTLTEILGVYGAAISTGLALLQAGEYRTRTLRQLRLTAAVQPPCETLEVEIANAGSRPINLKEVVVLYGLTADSGQVVDIVRTLLPQRLEESDSWSTSILREDLVRAARQRDVRQAYHHSLWVTAKTTIGKSTALCVPIPPAIITREHYPPAAPWIAVDLFLGFEQMESHIDSRPYRAMIK